MFFKEASVNFLPITIISKAQLDTVRGYFFYITYNGKYGYNITIGIKSRNGLRHRCLIIHEVYA